MQKHKRVQTPQHKPQRKRVPMKRVVKKLVDKWSASYIDNANQGHFPSILKLSELQYTGQGFGRIKYNPTQGRRWIEFAASTTGSPRAKDAYRRLVVKEEQTRDKIEHLRRYALHSGEHISARFDPNKDQGLLSTKGHTMQWEWQRGPFSPKPKLLLEYEEMLAARAERKAAKLSKVKLDPETVRQTYPDDPEMQEKILNAQQDADDEEEFFDQGPEQNDRQTVVDLDSLSPQKEFQYLQEQKKIKRGTKYSRHDHGSQRWVKGIAPIAHDFPQVSSRFELNYAIKAALDGKMQRKVTDPIPRPIHEYVMVARTPVPELVDTVSQSIHLAELLKDSLKPQLETALTGRTYLKHGATLADLPVVPTPVGTVRRYRGIVDEEFDLTKEAMGAGTKAASMDLLQIGMDEYLNSFWPVPNISVGHNIKKYREAYLDTMDQQEFSKLRHLQHDDDHEHHGQIKTNRLNPHFDELGEREIDNLEALPPHMMFDESELTVDPDMELDNLRGINIGLEVARESATPVDEGGRFPYNGLQKRSFFLSDPFNLAKPWMILNDSGSDMGEEDLPDNGYTTILKNSFSKMYLNAMQQPGVMEAIPETAQVDSDNHNIDAFQDRFLDPNPFSPRAQYTRRYKDTLKADLLQEAKLYSSRNYLTRKQYSHQYFDSVSKFDPEDQVWYINNDVLDVKKLPRTADPATRKKQVKELVENWMNIHAMQKKQAQDQNRNNLPSAQEPFETRKIDRKYNEIVAQYDEGRSTHGDFALYSANKKQKEALALLKQKQNNFTQHAVSGTYENMMEVEGAGDMNYEEFSKAYDAQEEKADQFLDSIQPHETPSCSEDEINIAQAAHKNNIKNNIARLQPRRQKLSSDDEESGEYASESDHAPIVKTKQVKQTSSGSEHDDSEFVDSESVADIAYTPSELEQNRQLQDIQADQLTDNDSVGHNSWIKPIDLELKLADDGHFNGYNPLGSDLSAYVPSDKQTRKRTPMALHPADGSPIALNPSNRLRHNVAKFQNLYSQIFDDIAQDGVDIDSEADESGEQRAAAIEQLVRQQLEMKLEHLVEDFNNSPEKAPEEDASDDSDLYDTTQLPYIRPLITEYGGYHPFWNRVIPNPAVFTPTPRDLRRVKREQRSYEEDMWNQYAENDAISYNDVMDKLEQDQTKNRFIDSSRMAPYHSDADSSDIDFSRTYGRDDLEDKLESGRFVVARRKDVQIIKPPTVTRM